MHAWRTLRRLPARDRILLAEATGFIIGARLGIRLLSIQRLRSLLAGPAAQNLTSVSAEETSGRVAWAVSAVASRLPGRTSCLIEALAVEAMLRRRGHECELRLGVPPASAANAGFAAHAWIESEGQVVIGAVSGLDEYAVFSRPPKF